MSGTYFVLPLIRIKSERGEEETENADACQTED